MRGEPAGPELHRFRTHPGRKRLVGRFAGTLRPLRRGTPRAHPHPDARRSVGLGGPQCGHRQRPRTFHHLHGRRRLGRKGVSGRIFPRSRPGSRNDRHARHTARLFGGRAAGGRTRRFSATTTGRSPSATILRQPWDSGFCRTDAASANSTTRRRSAASESASSNTSAPAKTTFSSSPASAGCSRSSGAAASTCTTCAADGTRSAHAPCRPANSSRPPSGSTASSRSWPNASASRTRPISSPCGKTWSATRCYGPQTTSVSATAGASSEPLPPARSCSAQRPTRPAGIRC